MKNSALMLSAALLLTFAVPSTARSNQENNSLILKVYDVGDLLAPSPDYPYRGGIPTARSGLEKKTPFAGGGGFGGTGGGFGGGGNGGSGGGGGGGFFQVPQEDVAFSPPAKANVRHGRMTIEGLIEAIIATVHPDTWEVAGGPGVCHPLGQSLLVRQTAAVHEEIAALLDALENQASAVVLTIEARWLQVSQQRLDDLMLESSSSNTASSAPTIPVALMGPLTADTQVFGGRISCFDNQTVHLVSGERRNIVTAVIPVVGTGAIGYQSMTSLINVGALLEVTPSLVRDGSEVVLNVQSTVTEHSDRKPEVSASIAEGVPGIDMLGIRTQQLSTSVRVPVNQPVLVGGMSSVGATSSEKAGQQLHLVLTVRRQSGD